MATPVFAHGWELRNSRDFNSGTQIDDSDENAQSRDLRAINRAVDNCVAAVQRDGDDLDSIDNVGRDDDGWQVDGMLADGNQFSCQLDQDGRVQGLNIDDGASGGDDAADDEHMT